MFGLGEALVHPAQANAREKDCDLVLTDVSKLQTEAKLFLSNKSTIRRCASHLDVDLKVLSENTPVSIRHFIPRLRRPVPCQLGFFLQAHQ